MTRTLFSIFDRLVPARALRRFPTGQVEGGFALPAPERSDWAWRPDICAQPVSPQEMSGVASGSGLGRDLKLFHDCTKSHLTLRQFPDPQEGTAPYGLRLDVSECDGSFLSLVLDMPAEGLRGLRRNHLLGCTMTLALEAPMEIFCRLNIQHGPNTEQLVRTMSLAQGENFVEFDLAYGGLDEIRAEKAWIDLICEGGQTAGVTICDLTLSRRPRAEI